MLGALLGTAFHGAWLAALPDSGAAAAAARGGGHGGVLHRGRARARSPAAVLLIEMTGSYGLALPILVGSLAAYGVAEWLGSVPIYDSLLEREFARRG